jgi:hypothetical protein
VASNIWLALNDGGKDTGETEEEDAGKEARDSKKDSKKDAGKPAAGDDLELGNFTVKPALATIEPGESSVVEVSFR